MANKKRYAVVIDTYVYAENDYMARKIAHEVKKECSGYEPKVIGITETPFASLQTRELKDISEPGERLNGLFGEIELPF